MLHPTARTRAVYIDGRGSFWPDRKAEYAKDKAKALVTVLVNEGVWFAVTPLPDDQLLVQVKDESHSQAVRDALYKATV